MALRAPRKPPYCEYYGNSSGLRRWLSGSIQVKSLVPARNNDPKQENGSISKILYEMEILYTVKDGYDRWIGQSNVLRT